MPRAMPGFRIEKAILGIAAWVMLAALPLGAQERQLFKGEIIDRKMGARYVLSSTENKTVYHLDDQTRSGAFAGESVLVIGSLEQATGTIHVTDMMRSLPPKVMKAVLVYVDCRRLPQRDGRGEKSWPPDSRELETLLPCAGPLQSRPDFPIFRCPISR